MRKTARTAADSNALCPNVQIDPALLVEDLPALIAYTDSQQRYVYVNKAYENFFGRTRQQLFGTTWAGLVGSEHYAVAEPYIRRALQGQSVTFASSLRRSDNELRDVQVSYTPRVSDEGMVTGFISLIRDVTDHNRMGETQARLAAIVDSSDDAIVSKTLDGVITSWNRSAERIFGYTGAEAIGRHITLIIPPDRWAEEEEVLARLRRGEKVDHFETERRAKDGRTVYVSLSVSPLRNGRGEIVGASKVARDITHRRRSEEGLRASEEYRRAVLESLPECVKVLDRNGIVLQMNPAGLAMVEAESPDDVIGTCVYSLINEDDREAFRVVNESVFSGGEGGRLQYGVRGLRGGERILETIVVPLRGATEEVIGALSVTRDITSRRRAESRDAFLVRLDDSTRPLSDPEQITDTVAHLLAEHLKVDRCSYVGIDGDAPTGEYLVQRTRTGEPYRIEDVEAEVKDPEALSAYRQMGIHAALAVPLEKSGRVVAGLAALSSTSRKWRPDEIELVQLVANRSWESIERARIERELRDNEQLFRTLANAIPNLAWMANPDGYIFWYNSRWYEYTGTTPEQMEGWGWETVHDPAVLPAVVEHWKRSLASGEPFDMTFPLRGADGRFRVFLTRVEPLKDRRGRVVRWFGTNTDVTTQQEAQRREKRARETAEVLNRVGPLLAAELDPQKLTQKITDIATEAVRAEFGCFFDAPGHAVGEPAAICRSSSPGRRSLMLQAMIRCASYSGLELHGGVRSDDVRSDSRFGADVRTSLEDSLRSYLAVPVRSRTGKVLGGLFFGHSEAGAFTREAEAIASGIAAQAAIALDNASLFEETRRSEEELRRSNEDLKRLNDDLNQFAYSASHDLREPLRMISIYTQLLNRKLRGQLDADGQEFIKYVLKGAHRMEALIRDLLAYTHAAEVTESGQQSTDAGIALNHALAHLAAAIEEHGAKVSYSTLPTVRIAEVHLTQLLQNLVGNAVKYRGDQPPEIRIGAARHANMWEFFVADNGIGIADEYKEQIFGIFKRLHHADKYSGTGIGLAICQRIVQRAGGRIWVESEPGQGSTFFFTLPAQD